MFYTTSIFINFGFISYFWGVTRLMRSFLGTPGLPYMAHAKLRWRNIENTEISNMTKIKKQYCHNKEEEYQYFAFVAVKSVADRKVRCIPRLAMREVTGIVGTIPSMWEVVSGRWRVHKLLVPLQLDWQRTRQWSSVLGHWIQDDMKRSVKWCKVIASDAKWCLVEVIVMFSERVVTLVTEVKV